MRIGFTEAEMDLVSEELRAQRGQATREATDVRTIPAPTAKTRIAPMIACARSSR